MNNMKKQLNNLIDLFKKISVKLVHLSVYLVITGFLNCIIVCIFDEDVAIKVLFYSLFLALGLPIISVLIVYSLKSLKLLFFGEWEHEDDPW